MTMPDYETMPKVELHLHLEGAVPIDALWTLVEARGEASGIGSIDELRSRFTFRDFAHFIDTWVWQNQFLDTYETFTFVAEAVARSLARQNILYSEVYFSPSDFGRHGLDPAILATSIREGLDRVKDTDVALILDVVRDTGPEMALRTFDQVREVAADARVVGITIGGSEAEFPPELFAPVYTRAEKSGFRLTAHAGEAAGADSVWSALRVLGVERIGHGIRSVEDEDLLELLVAQQVPLEVCPTSNLRTGVVAEWDEHPARRLLDAGAMVTLNSDDPAMFDYTLAGEYREVSTRFGLDPIAMRRLATNAVDASWAAPEMKARLYGLLNDWWEKR